jgi:hypothetical protein
MSSRTITGLLSVVLISLTAALTNTHAVAQSSATPEVKREFLFEVQGYTTENQGGQTLNMYFHYRYNTGIAEQDIPNYEDIRTMALKFLDGVDASQNPYWETLNQQMCTQLKDGFPLEAISCQLLVYPDNRTGLPYEPGYHGSIHTIGDIEPLAVLGSLQ